MPVRGLGEISVLFLLPYFLKENLNFGNFKEMVLIERYSSEAVCSVWACISCIVYFNMFCYIYVIDIYD